MFGKAVVLSGVLLLALTLFSRSVQAQENPFQIALVGPSIQVVEDDEDIRGIRLNLLYGVNRNVSGLDIEPVNRLGTKPARWDSWKWKCRSRARAPVAKPLSRESSVAV